MQYFKTCTQIVHSFVSELSWVWVHDNVQYSCLTLFKNRQWKPWIINIHDSLVTVFIWLAYGLFQLLNRMSYKEITFHSKSRSEISIRVHWIYHQCLFNPPIIISVWIDWITYVRIIIPFVNKQNYLKIMSPHKRYLTNKWIKCTNLHINFPNELTLITDNRPYLCYAIITT